MYAERAMKPLKTTEFKNITPFQKEASFEGNSREKGGERATCYKVPPRDRC